MITPTKVAANREALAKRRPKSRTRGRRGAPPEVVWRLLLLKYIRHGSDQVLEREARANLVYRVLSALNRLIVAEEDGPVERVLPGSP